MLWMISIEKHVNRKSKLYLMHQQKASCGWEGLRSVEFQNHLAAGGDFGGNLHFGKPSGLHLIPSYTPYFFF